MPFFRRSRGSWDPQRVLEQQLAMNRQTWAALQSHGVTEATELRLDFAYVASDRAAADALAGFLHDETDYDVAATEDSVTGRTQPTLVSAAILDQWVDWMVSAGAEYGRCEFDGWGASIPS